eukprot:11013029-Lingulodinium_polyedra.AAC.1
MPWAPRSTFADAKHACDNVALARKSSTSFTAASLSIDSLIPRLAAAHVKHEVLPVVEEAGFSQRPACCPGHSLCQWPLWPHLPQR